MMKKIVCFLLLFTSVSLFSVMLDEQNHFEGEIIRGNGYGRKIGFPTANIHFEDFPTFYKPGIYAGWARLHPEGSMHKAAMHMGPRPAISDEKISFEVHLLEFEDRDLYGQYLEFVPTHYLRSIDTFDESGLIEAIRKDCEEASKVLVEPPSSL